MLALVQNIAIIFSLEENIISMMLKKYTFDSKIAGPKVLFLGAIHGNEPAGAQAIFKVVEKFASHAISPLKGIVEFIPVCNPLAFEKNVRQIDENLNRVIKDWDAPTNYEQQLGKEIASYIKNSDIIIDLHSSHCPQDKPFIFSDYPDKTADKLCLAQTIQYIVKGWPEIYSSSPIADFSTGNCAHYYNKTCLTIECGWHQSPQSEQVAYYAIMNTLLSLQMLEGFPAQSIEQTLIMMDCFIIKQFSGKLTQSYRHLDKVSKGEILASYDNGKSIICPQDGFIMLPNADAAINTEWFYLGHSL